MPITKYLNLTIGDKQVQITSPEDLPISIDYALEDPDNFQSKPSSQALSLKVPATILNNKAGNTFHNPDIMDLTTGESFRSNQPFVIDENGFEIMNGKAFLNNATHNDQPLAYEYDLFGDNANWKIDLEETTLFDFLKQINFIFTKGNIIASWAFDGTDPGMPYVFAPVRYRAPVGGNVIIDNVVTPDDDNVAPIYLKPSLSKYWIIYWALKSVGYRLRSDFFDLPFFRRQVMPWTWGGFLVIEGSRLDIHRFRAKSLHERGSYQRLDTTGTPADRYELWDLEVSNDNAGGMFDNNDDYQYSTVDRAMNWTYNAPDYGILDATFSISVDFTCSANIGGDVGIRVYWYVNGIEKHFDQVADSSAGNLDVADVNTDSGIRTFFYTAEGVSLGDIVTAKIKLRIYRRKLGIASAKAAVLQYQLDYFRIPLGGTINFLNYPGFKKYKFLDFLRGVIDEFNISINTDPINKVVYMEPTHGYSITDDPLDTSPGYFVDDFKDWNKKRDMSKEWMMENYNDYDRELTFAYKDDSNDGILKKVQDRNINRLAAGKYVFPERFKTGKQEIENRFFSATMHYEATQWKAITGTSPQLVCLIPENVSNTSNSESENTFVPKSCYYKGNITGVGGWKFDGDELTSLPFLFAVNYKDGGQDDPILSYSDERISDGSDFVIGKGLLKRFYWQRLAIMRNGQFYTTWFRLKNIDIANQLHREHISFAGHRWELVQIKGYKPLQDISTSCFMRRWAPVSLEDFNNTFPSADNVLTNSSSNSLDIKYAQLKGLTSDIPR